MALPSRIPAAPPIVSKGASVPPDVPLPRALDHATNFIVTRNRIALIEALSFRKFVML